MWHQQALFAFLETKLWIGCILCEIALCIALIKRSLLRGYPCLFGLAFVNAIRDIGLASMFGAASEGYPKRWAVTLPILMSVQVATVLEAYTKLIAQYPGLGVFASKLMRCCLALLVLASCISAAWDFHHFPESILQAILFTYRYVAFVLAGCLALPCIVLWRFPKPDKQPARNITVHLWMLVSYFCVYGLGFLSVNLLGLQETTITKINVITTFALCILYASWAFVLTPAAEISLPWPKPAPDLMALMDARNRAAIDRAERLRQARVVSRKGVRKKEIS